MLYSFGDSFTFGYNFFLEDNTKRTDLIWPKLLGDLLNLEFKNIAFPGVSNWWIARQIMSLDIKENDIVVVAWSSSIRFEFGVNDISLSPKSRVYNTEKLFNPEDLFNLNDQPLKDVFFGFDIIEKNKDLLVRRYTNSSSKFLRKESHNKLADHVDSLFNNHYNLEWLESMSFMMMLSALYKLQKSKCKFRMFNAFSGFSSKQLDLEILRIPEYIFGPEKNMLAHLRNLKTDNIRNSWQHPSHNIKNIYYTPTEHQKISKILYESL